MHAPVDLLRNPLAASSELLKHVQPRAASDARRARALLPAARLRRGEPRGPSARPVSPARLIEHQHLLLRLARAPSQRVCTTDRPHDPANRTRPVAYAPRALLEQRRHLARLPRQRPHAVQRQRLHRPGSARRPQPRSSRPGHARARKRLSRIAVAITTRVISSTTWMPEPPHELAHRRLVRHRWSIPNTDRTGEGATSPTPRGSAFRSPNLSAA